MEYSRKSLPHHYLLKARSRDFSLMDIMSLTGGEYVQLAYAARFRASGGQPECPQCGSRKVYIYPNKTNFSCRPNNHSFSLTARTVLANSKLSLKQIIVGVYRFSRSLKGCAAITTSHDLGCTYQAAFDLNMRIRKAISRETEGMVLRGTVHIDGAEFAGSIRKPNYRKALYRPQRKKSRTKVLMTITELKGRTLTNVFPDEAHSIFWILKSVHPAATIYTDGAGHFESLATTHKRRLRQVNHSEAFSDRGVNTNRAESRFSMARRMDFGIYHRMSGQYLRQYGEESAWHYDHRFKSDRAKFDQLMNGAFAYIKPEND